MGDHVKPVGPENYIPCYILIITGEFGKADSVVAKMKLRIDVLEE